MSAAALHRILATLALFLTGAFLGWYFGQLAWGLLAAAGLLIIYQLRQVLTLENALDANDFSAFASGNGIWHRIVAKVQTEQERAAKHKLDYRNLLREIQKSTNAMPDGAVILDAKNVIVSANRAAKTLAGLKRKKDRGRRIDHLLRDPDLIALINGNDHNVSVDIPSPISEGIWLNCRIVPYGAEQKLLLLRDITERRNLNKMRRDFVANASHELRSPLTVINGYLDALAESDDLADEWAKPVQQMRNQSLRMKQIVGEMLELSRLENSGSATLDEDIDMGELLGQVRDDFERPADSADIVVEVESDALLLGRRSEIESVVVNLLSNALRYTPTAGSVTLTWRSAGNGAALVVTDTGEGIDAQHIPRLTERFFRVDRGRSRDEGGIGLGLAIVKHVLVRHDAELDVQSEPGRGSKFRCLFPATRLTAESIHRTASAN